jgi:hypothetical protein
MTIDYHPHPEGFLGTGTVFIAWDPQDSEYWAYWDSMPDGDVGPLEEGPRTSSIDEVVSWGRKRAPRVLIRPEADPGEYHWAGEGEPLGEDAALKRLQPKE